MGRTFEATNISVSNLKRWVKKGPSRKIGSGRKIMYPALETRLLEYIRRNRAVHKCVSVEKLVRKERELARELECTKIRFSHGWVQKFLQRNCLSRRKSSSNVHLNIETLEPTIYGFKHKFSTQVLDAETYDLLHVINVDETSITRDTPPDTTIEFIGTKSIPIKTTGSQKTAYTVILAASYAGEKLPAVLIWPSKGKRNINSPLPDNLYMEYREKSWVDKEIMLKWVSKVLHKRKRNIVDGKKGLLILDGFKAHLHPEVRERIAECNFDLWVLSSEYNRLLATLGSIC